MSSRYTPNPVADQLIVEASGATSAGKFRIYNASGKMLLSKDVKFSGALYQVETSALPTGIYTIQMLNETGKTQVQIFVKLGR
ncbi:MAG: T9SS type A sorting domain-containing protein [Dyadobacter sp.]|uniref:T9SS type A sorting domain-containing protein n=1 Tax=Dyadobacter sp. TaxID=1914288 RepID=UPI003265685E